MDAVNKMRVPRRHKVVLTVEREGGAAPFDVSLVREIIKIQSVRHKMLDNGIGYLRLTQFQEQSGKDLTKALDALRSQKVQSLILDLRNNPGGLLTAAVEVSELFLPKGKGVVSIKGPRAGPKNTPRTVRTRSWTSR
jgi:carboxyl-terminal processing protease